MKRPVLPLTQIQYLREVPGFRSAGHIYGQLVVAIAQFQGFMAVNRPSLRA